MARTRGSEICSWKMSIQNLNEVWGMRMGLSLLRSGGTSSEGRLGVGLECIKLVCWESSWNIMCLGLG